MRCRLVTGTNDSYDYLHFEDDDFSCKIVPEFGGSVQELIVNRRPLLWGCRPDQAGRMEYLKFCNSGWLFPFPNRIEDGQYSFEGKAYQLPINEPAKDNAIHGFVFDRTFEIEAFNDHSARLQCEVNGVEGFPFPFRFEVEYTIESTGISIKASAYNLNNKDFPVGIGWHPYFNFNNPTESKIEADILKKFVQSDRMIPQESITYSNEDLPSDTSKLDDLFEIGNSEIVFRTGEYNCAIDSDFGHYVQLYAPPDQKAIAIEPMSCPGNAFNSQLGLKTLRAGEKIEWNLRISAEII